MNPKVKRLWVEALRSGEYRKAKYRLRDRDRFSVLGVLCDVYLQEVGRSWNMFSSRNPVELPWEVMAWACLVSPDPSLGSVRISELAHWGYSFRTIANLIEAHL